MRTWLLIGSDGRLGRGMGRDLSVVGGGALPAVCQFSSLQTKFVISLTNFSFFSDSEALIFLNKLFDVVADVNFYFLAVKKYRNIDQIIIRQ